MSSGSWPAFAAALAEENRALGELGAAALEMTSVLVFGDAGEIDRADRAVDQKRTVHAQAHVRRCIMMNSGFGDLKLRAVCRHAPSPLRASIYASLREMTTRAIALQITVGNNKSLIVAGLQRISNTLAVLQKHMGEQTGTYKWRGTAAPTNGSLIVSRRA